MQMSKLLFTFFKIYMVAEDGRILHTVCVTSYFYPRETGHN